MYMYIYVYVYTFVLYFWCIFAISSKHGLMQYAREGLGGVAPRGLGRWPPSSVGALGRLHSQRGLSPLGAHWLMSVEKNVRL